MIAYSFPDYAKFDRVYIAELRDDGGLKASFILELDRTAKHEDGLVYRELMAESKHSNAKLEAEVKAFRLNVLEELRKAGWVFVAQNGVDAFWVSPCQETKPNLAVTWPAPFVWPECPPEKDGRYLVLIEKPNENNWVIRFFLESGGGWILQDFDGHVLRWLPLPPTEETT